MGRIDEQDFDEKRLARRQRRQRSQLIAYIILAVLCVALIGGGAFGVHTLRSKLPSLKRGNEAASAADSEASAEATVAIATPEESSIEPKEMTEDDVLTEIVRGVIAEMTLEDKIAGLFIATPEQLTGVETVIKAGSSTQEALGKYAIGGLYYQPKNIKSEDQVTEMLKATAEMSKYPIFTVIRESGSSTSALTATVGAGEIGKATDAESAYSFGAGIAFSMFKYGFNMNLAPNLDYSEAGEYGTDVEAVKSITAGVAKGLAESGVTACVCDFPVSADASGGMVALDEVTADTLGEGSYQIFKNAFEEGGAGAVMLSNASLPQVTGDNTPVSLSKTMIEDELRTELGFNGVVITGPLNQAAITEYYTSGQAAIAAINAGADMIFLPENFEDAYNGLLAAVQAGDISEERINQSLSRIYRIKYADRAKNN